MLMAISTEARATVWGWACELYEENIYKIFFDGEVEETVGLKSELDWLPEGTEFVTKYDAMGGESFIYTDETELLINFLYSTDPDSIYYLITEDAVRQDVIVNGLTGKGFISPSEEETNTIVWSDDSIPIMFTFTAEYDVETLIKVAENIKVLLLLIVVYLGEYVKLVLSMNLLGLWFIGTIITIAGFIYVIDCMKYRR